MTDYAIIKNQAGEIQSITRNKAPQASIPVCAGNSDYSQYLIDVDNGATVDEVVMPAPVVQPSAEERLTAAEDMIAAMLEGGL